MKIRTATIDDLDEITSIESICFPVAEAASRKDIKNRLEVFSDCFWVLEDNERIISFVNGMVTNEPNLTDEMYDKADMHDEYGDWQMIFGVDTLPSYRKQGCAGMLLRHVIEQARIKNRKGIVLTCKDCLVDYYKKFGFVNEGISKSQHGNVQWYQMRLTF